MPLQNQHQMMLSHVDRQLSNLRLKDIIGESVFNADERESSRRKFRIPEWQRFPSWPLTKEQNLVDSVMRNYPIHSIITTGHHDGRPFFYIQDGQTRLNALQRYLIDKFTWNGRLFSELSSDEQEHFRSYDIPVTTITFDDEDPNAMSEASTIFERLNAGKPLSSNEKYHNRINTPVLQFIMNELKVHPDLRAGFDKFVGKIGFKKGCKTFPLLGDMVGAVLTIALRQPERCKTSYDVNSQYLNHITQNQKEEVILFFQCWFACLTQALNGLAKPNKEYGKLSGVFGLAIYDWITGSPTRNVNMDNISSFWPSTNRNAWIWFVIQLKVDKKYKDNVFNSLQKGHRQNLDVPCIVARRDIVIDAYFARDISAGLGLGLGADAGAGAGLGQDGDDDDSCQNQSEDEETEEDA